MLFLIRVTVRFTFICSTFSKSPPLQSHVMTLVVNRNGTWCAIARRTKRSTTTNSNYGTDKWPRDRHTFAETDWSHLVLIELPRITIKPTQNDIGSVNCLAYRRAPPSTASSNDLFWLFSVQLEKHDSTWPHNNYSLSALRNHAWVEIMIDVRGVVEDAWE